MNVCSVRAIIFSALMTLVATGFAAAQTAQRPPVGGIGQLPDAMIFYVAHGAPGACGPGCSEWIAAEGIVQWDTHKRLIAILDRQAGRKLPVVIHSWGESNLNVATSLWPDPARPRHRYHGGVDRSRNLQWKSGSGMLRAQARQGGPLDARLDLLDARCELACVFMLAGGVHRSLPAGTRMILSGMSIHNRLAPNVSEERREGLTARFGELFRIYLREMGVEPELLDIIDRNSESRRQTDLPSSEWTRLRIVSASSL